MQRLEDGGLIQLRRWIDEASQPRLVVIDTFAKVRRQKGGSEGVYDSDYLSAAPLKALADETGVAIVVIHHVRKQAADSDPLDTVSGSTGLTGAVDTILILNRGTDGVTLYGRGRDIQEIDTAMQFEKDVCRWRVLGDAAEVRTSDERKKLLEALRVEDGPMSPREVAIVTGHAYGSVRALFMKMARDGEVAKVGRGKYVLPDVTPRNNGNKVTRESL